MYQYLGDKDNQDRIRAQNKNNFHCKWLERCSTACESLPEGVEGVYEGTEIRAGMSCPHNVYVEHQAVFENRDAVAGTIDRLHRTIGSADAGLLSEKEMDSLSVTELLVSKAELNRQQATREKREYERAKLEAEVNKVQKRPGVMGSD